MGLSASVIYISEPEVGLKSAVSLGLVKEGATPLKVADPGFPTDGDVRISCAKGWSVVMLSMEDDALRLSDLLSTLSKGRKVFFWCTQSTAGLVWFEMHIDGALRRRWGEAEEQVMEQIGEPLPEEHGLVDMTTYESGPIHDEWSMLSLTESLTGLSQDDHFENTGPMYAAAF